MKKIRIGNDIQFQLTFPDVEDLEGRDLTVTMINALARVQVKEFSIVGNRLDFVFPGKDQRILGTYRITVVENNNNDNMRVADICDAFALVALSCQTGGNDPDGLTTVALSFEIALAAGKPISYEDLYQKPRINGVEVSGDKTLSDFGIIESEQVLSNNIASIIEPLDEPEDVDAKV